MTAFLTPVSFNFNHNSNYQYLYDPQSNEEGLFGENTETSVTASSDDIDFGPKGVNESIKNMESEDQSEDTESERNRNNRGAEKEVHDHEPVNEFNLLEDDWPSLIDSKTQFKLERKHVNRCMHVKTMKVSRQENGAKPKNLKKKKNGLIIGKSSLRDSNKVPKVKLKEKEKKWKEIDLEETGFNMSLFPRPQYSKPNVDNIESYSSQNSNIEVCMEEYDQEFVEIEQRCLPFNKHLGFVKRYDFKNITVRRDRHRRVEKAKKQIRQKQCRSIQNNKGRCILYAHHRMFKVFEERLDSQRKGPNLPKNTTRYSGAKHNNWSASSRPVNKTIGRSNRPNHPIQSLAHTLCEDNVPTDIDHSIASVLMSIQHRELTPLDYELLLQLDERVAPKTISDCTLEQFRKETINNESLGESCPVCMDPYVVGDVKKFLPCGHGFHSNCIDMWLKNSSQNCPLDGLSVSS